jgi:hypothetical protein
MQENYYAMWRILKFQFGENLEGKQIWDLECDDPENSVMIWFIYGLLITSKSKLGMS